MTSQVCSTLHTLPHGLRLTKREAFMPVGISDFSTTQLQDLESVDLPPFQHTEMPSPPLVELQDFIPADTSEYPASEISDFLATEARTASMSVEIINHPVINSLACPSIEIKSSPRETISLPPTDLLVSTYPPSPPTSIRPIVRVDRRMTYMDAVSHGNVLLYLPRCVRKRIFTYLLTDYPELHNIEIPETRDFSKAFPEFCHSLDIIYSDTCLLIIQDTTFTMSSDGAIFNLMVFLNEFSDKKGYEAVQSLEFAGRTIFGKEESALGPFERGEFTSNATELLQQC